MVPFTGPCRLLVVVDYGAGGGAGDSAHNGSHGATDNRTRNRPASGADGGVVPSSTGGLSY